MFWRGVVLLVGTYFALAGCAGKAEHGAVSVDSAVAAPAAHPSSEAGSVPALRPPATARRPILFIGTSLTAGLGLDPDSAYPQLIQLKIDSAGLPFEVTNAGVSGETSAGLLQRLDWLMRGDFDVVLVETGANDGLRGIPVASVERNIREIVRRIQQSHPRARVLLVQMEALPNLGPAYARDFHAMYPAIAKETGVALLPFLLAGVAGDRSLNQGDGVHPNQRGEHIVAANVWRTLGPLLRSMADSARAAAAGPGGAPRAGASGG